MESSIIVEEFTYLEKVHKVRCTRLIADGDSNTMALAQKNLKFGKKILKVECANHAVRQYRRFLERLQKGTSQYPGPNGIKCRKLLKCHIPRLVLAARMAIKKNALKSHHEDRNQAVQTLVTELRNAPDHVFGKHTYCGDFCKRQGVELDDANHRLMIETGMLSAVSKALDKTLLASANTLIWNATNNPAENYMSQLCKTIGGKRINFPKSGGIVRRANAAALAYQSPAQAWHRDLHKTMSVSPRTPIRKLLLSRRKQYLRQIRRRQIFPQRKIRKAVSNCEEDSSYGTNPEQAEMTEEMIKVLGDRFIENLKDHTLPERTVGQHENDIWRTERSKRLPSSFFKNVGSRRKSTACAKLVKRIIYGENVNTPAMRYGREKENVACNAYAEKTGHVVEKCGLYIDCEEPFLCTSPDGLIGVLAMKAYLKLNAHSVQKMLKA